MSSNCSRRKCGARCSMSALSMIWPFLTGSKSWSCLSFDHGQKMKLNFNFLWQLWKYILSTGSQDEMLLSVLSQFAEWLGLYGCLFKTKIEINFKSLPMYYYTIIITPSTSEITYLIQLLVNLIWSNWLSDPSGADLTLAFAFFSSVQSGASSRSKIGGA